MTIDVGRKVRQLDNDVQAIYEIMGRVEASQDKLIGTQKRQGNRLDEIAGEQTTQSEKLDQIGNQLVEVLRALSRGNG